MAKKEKIEQINYDIVPTPDDSANAWEIAQFH